MQKTVIWIALMLVVLGSALWFSVRTVHGIVDYVRLSNQVSVQIENWHVKEVKSGQFALLAQFTYAFKGKEYQAVRSVGSLYPNRWAAEQGKERWAKKQLTVWLDPRNPQKTVSFNKKFPYKATISLGILIGLLLYFIGLGCYVKRKQA